MTASNNHYNLDLMGGGVAGTPASGFRLGFLDRVKFRYISGTTDTTYPLKFRSEAEFDMLIQDNNRPSDDMANIYTLRPGDDNSVNGYIDIYPTPTNTGLGTLQISAFRGFNTVDNDIDTTPVPIPSIIEHYLVSFIERIRGNDAKAEYYENLFYGPPVKVKGRQRLTGIALLENLNFKAGKPNGQSQSLVKFQGRRGAERLYGQNKYSNRDYIKENYW